jgi:hypothetical protein
VQPEVLGFDFRFNSSWYADEWPADRRAEYLINPRVESPLSVDTLVWPSVFDVPAESMILRNPLAPLLLEPDLEDYRQQAFGLWSSADKMAATVIAGGASARGSAIAIEIITNSGLLHDEGWHDRIGHVSACTPSNVDWPRVGFDVADIDLVSALSNPTWPLEDETDFRFEWIGRVNRHGLLRDLDSAVEFASQMSRKAPAETRLFVFRLAIKAVPTSSLMQPVIRFRGQILSVC